MLETKSLRGPGSDTIIRNKAVFVLKIGTERHRSAFLRRRWEAMVNYCVSAVRRGWRGG